MAGTGRDDGAGRRRVRATRAVAAAAIGSALALGAAGCSAADAVRSSVETAGSASRSATLAVELLADDASWGVATDTALRDALAELEDAGRGLADLAPADPADDALRDDALSAVRDAIDAVAAARSDLAAGRDPADAVALLEEASEALTDLEDSTP